MSLSLLPSSVGPRIGIQSLELLFLNAQKIIISTIWHSGTDGSQVVLGPGALSQEIGVGETTIRLEQVVHLENFVVRLDSTKNARGNIVVNRNVKIIHVDDDLLTIGVDADGFLATQELDLRLGPGMVGP